MRARHKLRLLSLAGVVFCLAAMPARAQVINESRGSGDFHDPDNWSLGITPRAGQDVVIRAQDSLGTPSRSYDMNSLTVNGVLSLYLLGTRQFRIADGLTINGRLRSIRCAGAQPNGLMVNGGGMIINPTGEVISDSGEFWVAVRGEDGFFRNEGTWRNSNAGNLYMLYGEFRNTSTGSFVSTSPDFAVIVFDDLINEQPDTARFRIGGLLDMRSRGNDVRLQSASSPVRLGALTVALNRRDDTLAPEVDIETAGRLQLHTGRLNTNGHNLHIGGRVDGRHFGGLVVTGNSVVSVGDLYQQSRIFDNVKSVEIGPNDGDDPTVTIRGLHTFYYNSGDVAPDLFAVHRGTVNYDREGAVCLDFSYGGWDDPPPGIGWHAFGGTVNFRGDIRNARSYGGLRASVGDAAIRFTGGEDQTVTLISESGYDCRPRWEFNRLVIDKPPTAQVRFESNPDADLLRSVTAAALDLAGGNLVLAGRFRDEPGYKLGDVTVSGGFAPDDDGVNNSIGIEQSLTVNSGRYSTGNRRLILGRDDRSAAVSINRGEFSAVATTATAVEARSADHPYRFTVNAGGTIAARNAVFARIDSSGIVVAGGATIDPDNNFSYCSFDHGAVGGPMLKIENDQVLTMQEVSFSGSDGYNIEKLTDAGHITVASGGGDRWGEEFESDPHSRIDWTQLAAGEEPGPGLPDAFAVGRVAPNPLGRTGLIRLALPAALRVRVRLYDAVGRQVRAVADRPMAAGRYELRLDAAGLAGGVYLLRVEAGEYSATQKLVVRN